MMTPFKAFSKQLLGARYERIPQSVIACSILYLSLSLAQLKIAVAPSILYLSATAFTGGVIWEAFHAGSNAERLTGILALPFKNLSLVAGYVGAFSCYAVITKTSLLLSLLFAVGSPNIPQMVLAVLLAFHACAVMAVFYSRKRIGRVLTMLWMVTIIAAIFLIESMSVLLGLTGMSLLLAIFCIARTDAYRFYPPVGAKATARRRGGSGSVFVYLLRYLMAHKSYLLNTAGMWCVACFLPFLFGQFEGINFMPLGFAILTLNTPICILLSCDPDLEQMLRVLPRQEAKFGLAYCLFVFLFNLSAVTIYLISWWRVNHFISAWAVTTAILFSLQSAVFSVLLEWVYPLRRWKIESDLWHHPRKYIVPCVMLVLAVAISSYPRLTLALPPALLMECLVLMMKLRWHCSALSLR